MENPYEELLEVMTDTTTKLVIAELEEIREELNTFIDEQIRKIANSE